MFDWSPITNNVLSFCLGVISTLVSVWLKRERIEIRSNYSGGQLYVTVFNPTHHAVNLSGLQFQVRHKGTKQWEEIAPNELTEHWPEMQIPPRNKIVVLLGGYACISHGMADESRFTVSLTSGKKYVHVCKRK